MFEIKRTDTRHIPDQFALTDSTPNLSMRPFTAIPIPIPESVEELSACLLGKRKRQSSPDRSVAPVIVKTESVPEPVTAKKQRKPFKSQLADLETVLSKDPKKPMA